MKISIGRLKEIIMEEVAKAAAVEESYAARATPEVSPPEVATGDPPPPPKTGLLKYLTDLFGPIDPERQTRITKLASDMHSREIEKHGIFGDLGLGESLNIEIVDDE